MAFYLGQKVVCVDDVAFEADGVQRLFADRVYTVREYLPDYDALNRRYYPDERSCLRLFEIQGRNGKTPDVPYAAARFRPVVERKTDISVFTALLDTKRVPEVVS